MPYDFDRVLDRRSTNSSKSNKYPEDVIPLWVADMDFRAPEAVLEALQSSLEFGVLGYDLETQKLQEIAAQRTWLDCNQLVSEGRLHTSAFEFFLKNAKVAFSDGATFGPGGQGFVCANFGCPRSVLAAALERVERAVSRR